MNALVTMLRGALAGKKTYLVGLMMILQGLYGLAMGTTATFDNPMPIPEHDSMMMILEGLGFGTVRAGITKSGPTS